MTGDDRRILIIAGPNGAGKTTFARVAERVQQGGRDIPEAVIRRRFIAGVDNFHQLYSSLVDTWTLYDNAGDEPVLVDWR